MDTGKLTVFFEEPFWVGVFERVCEGKLSASKVIFGGEPKDAEVYEFILKEYQHLRFSPTVDAQRKEQSRNPKRLQREARRQTQTAGIGTKSQQALKLQQEQGKIARREINREQREAEVRRKFELRQQKKREKHRGR